MWQKWCVTKIGRVTPEPAQCHKCHACHAKRRYTSPSATPGGKRKMVCKRWCVKDGGWKMVCERCVWRGGGGRREEAIQNQKQEPHTKMWGKKTSLVGSSGGPPGWVGVTSFHRPSAGPGCWSAPRPLRRDCGPPAAPRNHGNIHIYNI